MARRVARRELVGAARAAQGAEAEANAAAEAMAMAVNTAMDRIGTPMWRRCGRRRVDFREGGRLQQAGGTTGPTALRLRSESLSATPLLIPRTHRLARALQRLSVGRVLVAVVAALAVASGRVLWPVGRDGMGSLVRTLALLSQNGRGQLHNHVHNVAPWLRSLRTRSL